MKYCYACGQMSAGNPLFCHGCGRSYDRKVCPRLHVNARRAEACFRCGSRNLSTPQPKVPFLWRVLAAAIFLICGISLAWASLGFLAEAGGYLVRDQPLPASLLAPGLTLAALWGLCGVLPDVARMTIRHFLRQRHHRDLA